MKKLLFVMLVIALAAPAFAGDANVLPGGVGRFYFVPVYGFETATWDDDGEKQDIEDNDATLEGLFNLGAAVEYGITDQISLGLQWAPGFNFYAPLNVEDNAGDVEDSLAANGLTGYDGEPFALDVSTQEGAFGGSAFGQTEGVSGKGASPLVIGSEVQILGNQGYVQNDMFRLSVTPGLEVPLGQPNWTAQGKAYNDGEAYIDPFVYAAGLDPRWGLGGRMDFDFLASDRFYVNLQGEYKYRFERTYDVVDFYKETEGYIYGTQGALAGYEETLGSDAWNKAELTSGTYNRFIVELEPDYTVPVSGGATTLSGSLPITFSYDSEHDVDFKGEVESANAGIGKIDLDTDKAIELDESYTLYATPTFSVFFREAAMPLEFQAYYQLPVMGKNAGVRHAFVLEARGYFSTN